MISFYNLDQEYISFMSAGKCPIPHPPQKKKLFPTSFQNKKKRNDHRRGKSDPTLPCLQMG
jgi:hypothetical protein